LTVERAQPDEAATPEEAKPLKHTTLILTTVLILASIALGHLTTAHAQAVTTWFSYTSGSNTCTVDKVSQVPLKLTYLCKNLYGSHGGSYTADPVNGTVAANTFTLRIAPFDGSGSSALCTIGINGTAAPVAMGSLGTVQPNSAARSCAGTVNDSISWP